MFLDTNIVDTRGLSGLYSNRRDIISYFNKIVNE